jgi:phage terminase large subunit-like protein
VEFRRCTRAQVPWEDLLRIVVWVDPAVEDSDRSDCHAVQCDALAESGIIYRLHSWEARATPVAALEKAIVNAIRHHAEAVGIETNQGGQTWRSVYREAAQELGLTNSDRLPPLRMKKAGAGTGPKAERQARMVADYQLGRIVHVVDETPARSHEVLEAALRRFLVRKPYDLGDVAWWSWSDLRRGRPPAHEFLPIAVG